MHSIQITKTSNIVKQDDSCIDDKNPNKTILTHENWGMITKTPEGSNLSSIKNETEFTLDWPCSLNN